MLADGMPAKGCITGWPMGVCLGWMHDGWPVALTSSAPACAKVGTYHGRASYLGQASRARLPLCLAEQGFLFPAQKRDCTIDDGTIDDYIIDD